MNFIRIFFICFIVELSFFMNVGQLFADHENPDVAQVNFVSYPYLLVDSVEQVTVQAQNSSGEVVDGGIGHLACIKVVSSSETGLFSSSFSFSSPLDTLITNWNTSWGNRNFYYKDPTEGDHTLNLEFAFRPESVSNCNQWPWEGMEVNFTASQEINISENPPEEDSSDNNGNTPDPQPGDPEDSSSHSDPSLLGENPPKIDFEVYAGRDRLSSPGSPLTFEAKLTKLEGIDEDDVSFEWSFGDGSVKKAKRAEHSYKNEGDYVVLVTASSEDKKAVSRLDVKVVSPKVSVIRANEDFIELENESQFEINLYKWRIYSGDESFTLPADVIILPGKKISVPSDVSGLKNIDGVVRIKNSSGKDIASLGFSGQVFGAGNQNLPLNPEVQDALSEMWVEAKKIESSILALKAQENAGQNHVSVADAGESDEKSFDAHDEENQSDDGSAGQANFSAELAGDNDRQSPASSEVGLSDPDPSFAEDNPKKVVEIESTEGFWGSLFKASAKAFSFFKDLIF